MTLLTGVAPLGRSYWAEGLAPAEFDDRLPEKVDLLVVGGGYTGLSAAMEAHDAGARVAVIDAGIPGEGASTRNGGMVGAHPRLGWETLARLFGTETADDVFAEAANMLDRLIHCV